MMDGCPFASFKRLFPLLSSSLEEPGYFLKKYNFDCIWLKEGSHIHLRWFEGEFNKISIFRVINFYLTVSNLNA